MEIIKEDNDIENYSDQKCKICGNIAHGAVIIMGEAKYICLPCLITLDINCGMSTDEVNDLIENVEVIL